MPERRASQSVPAVPDCQDCAACCYSTIQRYVRVMGDDYCRLGDAVQTLVEFIGNRAYLRMIDGHCAALVRDSTCGKFACQVYDVRPEICRNLARGSLECDAERFYKGERSELQPSKLQLAELQQSLAIST